MDMGNRWHGLRYPFKPKAQGLFTDPTDDELVDSNIRFVLATAIGEYITLPEFGSKLPEDVMEPNDAILGALIERHATDALTRWEPRIYIESIETLADEDEVNIIINYRRVDDPVQLRFFHDTYSRSSS